VSKIRPSTRHIALAAVALYMDEAFALAEQHGLAPEFLGWHSSHESPADYKLKWREQTFELDVLVHDGHVFTIDLAGEKITVDVVRNLAHEFHYLCEGVQGKARTARDDQQMWLDAEGAVFCYSDITLQAAEAVAAGSDGRLLAHSDGKVVAVHVKPGDVIEKGKTLAVLEAMKMEFQLALPVAGTVESVSVQAGQQVKNKQLLIQVKPAS